MRWRFSQLHHELCKGSQHLDRPSKQEAVPAHLAKLLPVWSCSQFEATAVQQRCAARTCWEQGLGSEPALSTQTRGGITSPRIQASICKDKAKITGKKKPPTQKSPEQMEVKMLIAAVFWVGKYSPCSKPFCLLTSTELLSPGSAQAQVVPLGLHPWFLLCPQLSAQNICSASLLPSLYLCFFLSRSLPSEVTVQYCSYARYVTLQRKGTFFLGLGSSLLLIHCPPCCM